MEVGEEKGETCENEQNERRKMEKGGEKGRDKSKKGREGGWTKKMERGAEEERDNKGERERVQKLGYRRKQVRKARRSA